MIAPPKTDLPVKPAPSGVRVSATHPQNAAKTWVAFSPNLQETLLKLRMQRNQDKAPSQVDAAPPGGPPKTAGSPAGTSVSGLSAEERNAIGRHIMPCFQVDENAPGAGFSAKLLVRTDAAGIVRDAVVAPQDAGRMSDPRFAAFAGRAMGAVMNQDRATLPLPAAMLGRDETLLFDF